MSAVGPKTGQLDLNIRQIRYHGSLAGTGKEEANCMEFYNAMRPRHKQCNLSLDDFEHSFGLKLGYKKPGTNVSNRVPRERKRKN